MLMRVVDAAKELGVSTEHIRHMIRSGRWPFYSLGPKATRIDPEEIKALGRLMIYTGEEKQSRKEKKGNES
jgi:excisionase family DNA binding protein